MDECICKRSKINGQVVYDASKINKGTVPLAHIPPTALERIYAVADQTARYALTTSEVQNGDTVKQNDTGVMYMVKDDANLGNANGYEEYNAGTAAACPWTGLIGVPAQITALAAYDTNGIITQTATGTYTGRTMTGTANRLDITNGDGVSGNPTFNVNTTLLPSPVGGDSGKFLKTTGADTGAWTSIAQADVTGLTTASSPAFTGLTLSGLTADRVLTTNSSSVVTASSVTTTTLGYLDATSSIQTQLNGKEPTLTKYDLTGTTNQVNLSASGIGVILGRNITLSLPQDIHTTATPQFAAIGVGEASSATIRGAFRNDDNSAQYLRMRNDTSGTGARSRIVASYGDFTQFCSLEQINPSFTTNGLFVANSSCLVSYGNTAGIRIFTEDAYSLILGTNNARRLEIDSSGNCKFGQSLSTYFQLYGPSNGNSNHLIFGNEVGNPEKAMFLESYWLVIQGHENQGVRFQSTDASANIETMLEVSGNNASGQNRETWFYPGGSGKVAINNNSPTYQLDVTGEINATAGYRINGTAGVSAGPFTSITSITVTNGIVTALTGS